MKVSTTNGTITAIRRNGGSITTDISMKSQKQQTASADPEIAAAVRGELYRQQENIELIAAESGQYTITRENNVFVLDGPAVSMLLTVTRE